MWKQDYSRKLEKKKYKGIPYNLWYNNNSRDSDLNIYLNNKLKARDF